MKNYSLIDTIAVLILCFAIALISSCNDDDRPEPREQYLYECAFEQIDENMDGLVDGMESQTMLACFDSRMHVKEDIESNLIGEWEIIGFGAGWTPTISQPCAYITITEDELSFDYEDAKTDTMVIHPWELIEIETPSSDPISPSYLLRIGTGQEHGLSVNIFCTDYMYIDATPVDGNMYLFQKRN